MTRSPFSHAPAHGSLVAFLAAVALLGACGTGDDSDSPSDAPTPFTPHIDEFTAIGHGLLEGSNELLGRGLTARMRLALENPELVGKDRFQLELALAERLLREGDIDGSIAMYSALLAAAKEGSQRAYTITRALGLAHLRAAENANCVARHVPDCCIFPLQGGGVHTEREPAQRAFDCFAQYLEFKPNHLATRWLLNVAALALGTYPDAVPAQHRIPLEAFESEEEIGRFVDVAPRLGLDTLNLCGGASVEDFDGDGLLDVLTSTYDPLGALSFFTNGGDGTFEDASASSHASDQLGGLNLVTGDYDGDGDSDVLLLRGAWFTRDGQMRNSLLRNDGGSFVDVTRAAGLADPARPTQAAAFGDFDGDGDLDLYVVNESMQGLDPEQDFPSQLFENRGDGTFVDVARAAGVENDRYGKGVSIGDFDNDGDLDIYVSNFGPNRLYRNDGGMRFVDVAPELRVTQPDERSFACWFFDYDNDGWLDLFVTSYVGGTAELAAEALGIAREHERPRLYHNVAGRFDEVGVEAGLDRFVLPMGANFGDLDADGWLDIYLTTGDPSLESIFPNVMFRNVGGARFADVTTSGGFGHLQKGHGVAFADLDNDGDQDVFHQLGGFYPVDAFHNALFLNPGHGHRFVSLELSGTDSNAGAVGARIAVFVATPTGPRAIHRAVGSVSSFGGSPRRQEIGLGDATAIERVEIVWPRSGARQVLRDVPLDAFLSVTEGAESFERVELPRLSF